MGFSRQEYWSGLPSPTPGDLPDPGIEPGSPALQADALPSDQLGKTQFQLSYFKSWKMRKCCTQYASKFGKLSSGRRTGKGKFSFQSQRKAMPKNVQTTTQLQPSHTLANYCSKFSKLGFNSTWTRNFQMFKLDLENAQRNHRSNCQHPLDHSKIKRISKKNLLLLHWLC